MKLPIKVPFPPIIFTSNEGKLIAACGSVWMEVPAGTNHETIGQYLLFEAYPKPDPSKNGSWEIPGSKGNLYKVRQRSGQWTCECVGFGFHRKCKHITKAKELK